MMRRIVNLGVLLVLAALLGNPASAQTRGILTVTVRSTAGVAIEQARLRAVGAGMDTTIRSSANGAASFVLNYGVYELTVNMIGYMQYRRRLTMDSEEGRLDVQLQRAVPQLDSFAVRDNWIGIRGTVGDAGITRVLDSVEVRALRGERTVTTDSTGRFALPLTQPQATVLRLQRNGYLPVTTYVSVSPGTVPDVVVLMEPGKARNIEYMHQFDLTQRMSRLSMGSFMISRDSLLRTGQKKLDEALHRSPELAKSSVLLRSRDVCVMINGDAREGVRLDAFEVSEIDFVEVWAVGRESTGTLKSRWPYRSACSMDASSAGYEARYVNVWLRRR